ncbi:LysR family transcriptional regulator [Halomonas sp. HAL1]|uniref:LysR family transcriptional regulator n=1 Tax=Halomonas sp. HAL1 TaxID=550984 RepID=UPI00022D27B5|nr:LysR family transcriptional regulator [Halomonas sp. HAL1]EHA15096.1 LysR family transcriptional regulator [Halomonas sp. HAL1]WKV94169.1 LysR family transcriptional regulator [Halomonas sp. HAL1]
MITFKQIETLYWISELGNFSAAADKLNTTQSAISKRISELETACNIELFDRTGRNSKLTDKGNELLMMSKGLLDRREEILERMCSKDVLYKRFRIGVTELTALTWLPSLVKMIEDNYPRVMLEPQVELSSTLFSKLNDDSLDLVIVPDVMEDVRYNVVPLKSVENAWMCKPGYFSIDKPIKLQELSQLNVLAQGANSGTGLIYDRWLTQHNIKTSKSLTSNNLVAQIGLTLSGIGVSYLPYKAFRPLIESGQLNIIETVPKLPQVRYAVIYRSDRNSQLYQDVADYAQACCDFSKLLIVC